MVSSVLEARCLSLSRGRHRVVDNLSVTFGLGITALLGPNGAGKTTLLEGLASLGRGGDGEVLLEGRIVSPAHRREGFAEVGFMPQDWSFFPGFTAREMVSYAGWLKGLGSSEASARAAESLGEVGLAAQMGVAVRKLSGGMRQRVGLAEAIVTDARVVLLDEPTVGLDPQQRLDFRQALRGRSERSAVVLSTHLTDDVQALADRVIVLVAGSIAFDGTVAELEARAALEPGVRSGSLLESGYMAVLEAS